MNNSRRKYLRRFLWFSSGLVAIVTAAAAYSIFVSERIHYGDMIDQVAADMHSQDAWAATRAIIVACGGLFVIGAMIFIGAWASHPTQIPDEKAKTPNTALEPTATAPSVSTKP